MLSTTIPSIEEARVLMFATDARRVQKMVEDELDHQGLNIVLPGEDQARANWDQGHLGEVMIRSHHEVRWVPPM